MRTIKITIIDYEGIIPSKVRRYEGTKVRRYEGKVVSFLCKRNFGKCHFSGIGPVCKVS